MLTKTHKHFSEIVVDVIQKMILALAVLPGAYIGLLFYVSEKSESSDQSVKFGLLLSYIVNLIFLLFFKKKSRLLKTALVTFLTLYIFIVISHMTVNVKFFIQHPIENFFGINAFFFAAYLPISLFTVIPGWLIFLVLDYILSKLIKIINKYRKT